MPTNAFLGVFAKSPIKPMEEHIKKVHQASKALIPFFNHVFKEEWQQAEELRLTIRNLEREADDMKRDIGGAGEDLDTGHYVRDSEICWLNDQWLYDLIWPHVLTANDKLTITAWFIHAGRAYRSARTRNSTR